MYTTEYWRDQLAAAAPDLPTDRLLAWIGEESGGRPNSTGKSYEVGIFQIDLQDGGAYGATIATLNISGQLTPEQEALQVSSGIAYVRHCLSVAQSELDAINATWGDDELWNLVKLQHALPALPKYMLPAADQQGQAGSWGDFRAFTVGASAAQVDSYTYKSCTPYMPFGRLFDNAERVGGASGPLGALAGFVDVQLMLGMAGALVALYILSKLLPTLGVG